jgi:XisH protein
MTAKDKFHDAVRAALEKENWVITDDPMKFQYGGVKFRIDLSADRLLAAERENEKIAVEVKSFLNVSPLTDFHQALGQFQNYRSALRKVDPARKLYLAVPLQAYKSFFKFQFVQEAIEEHQLLLIVYNADDEVIVQWED